LKVSLKCSYLQIYNENIYDLLTESNSPLLIREDKVQGVFVEGLQEYRVNSVWDCLHLLHIGAKNTFKRATNINWQSSRSHIIFQVTMQTVQPDAAGVLLKSKFNLCDLAGSEKMGAEDQIGKQHSQELRKINMSLTVLGKVISFLAKHKSGTYSHIPFRESKLTRLLQDSFGGGTKTLLVATISPTCRFASETISTLKFADRAKNVMQRVRRNQLLTSESGELVVKMQHEISFLKEMLAVKSIDQSLHRQIKDLKYENEHLKKQLATATDTSELVAEQGDTLHTDRKQ
jgi:FtsZ-binding cell division protein ZapB